MAVRSLPYFVSVLLGVLGTALPSVAWSQESENPVFRIWVLGEPPPSVVRFVAEIGAPVRLPFKAGRALGEQAAAWCNYQGLEQRQELFAALKAQNPAALQALGETDPPPADLDLSMPACLRRQEKDVVVPPNAGAGIGVLIRAELAIAYDQANTAKWGAFIDELCRRNADRVRCQPRKMDPVVQPGIVRFPEYWRATEIRLRPDLDIAKMDLPAGARGADDVARLLERFEAVLQSASREAKGLFEWRRPERVRLATRRLPGQGPPGNCVVSKRSLPLGAASEPFDAATFLQLAREYKAYAAVRAASYPVKEPQPVPIVTVVDTGVSDSRAAIGSRMFTFEGKPDSSHAQIGPRVVKPYQAGEYRPVEADLIANPEELPPGHGTEVTSAVVGEMTFDGVPLTIQDWPWVRAFRALRRSEVASGKYVLDELALENAFQFVGERLPVRPRSDKTEFREGSVVNVSLATKFSNSTESVAAALEKLRDLSLVVVAAGNEGDVLPAAADLARGGVFPAAFGGKKDGTGSFVVSVGATGATGAYRWGLSNYSSEVVDLFAWGECEPVVGLDVAVTEASGTSLAAPWVSLTAAFLLQGPLFGLSSPPVLKTRILSAVRSVPALWDKSESGGVLDPLRTIDVMVDHLVVERDGVIRKVRGLVDYRMSGTPCSGNVPALGNLARFERRPGAGAGGGDQVYWRARNYYQPPPNAYSPGKPQARYLTPCSNVLPDSLVHVYEDADFDRLASENPGEQAVVPTPYKVSEIREFVARSVESPRAEDVRNFLRDKEFRCAYLRTTAVVRKSTLEGSAAASCPPPG